MQCNLNVLLQEATDCMVIFALFTFERDRTEKKTWERDLQSIPMQISEMQLFLLPP